MSYDPNMPQDVQEELWLDDLKALLNDDPNYTPAAGKPAAPRQQTGYGQAGQQDIPGFHAYNQAVGGQPVWNQPRQQGQPAAYWQQQPNPYAEAAQKLYGQQPAYPQNGYPQQGYPQNGGFRQNPGYDQKPGKKGKAPKSPKAARKQNPVAGIVILSLLVIAEAAGIAAVAISWMQWMA